MGRKKARDFAFLCVYQLEYNKEIDINKLVEYVFTDNISDNDQFVILDNIEEKEFAKKIVNGVKENITEIDKVIFDHLKNWKTERITKVDLALLRIAIYEIMFLKEFPAKVSVNEAVELAKKYGTDDSSNFVNGVIAKIIEKV